MYKHVRPGNSSLAPVYFADRFDLLVQEEPDGSNSLEAFNCLSDFSKASVAVDQFEESGGVHLNKLQSVEACLASIARAWTLPVWSQVLGFGFELFWYPALVPEYERAFFIRASTSME